MYDPREKMSRVVLMQTIGGNAGLFRGAQAKKYAGGATPVANLVSAEVLPILRATGINTIELHNYGLDAEFPDPIPGAGPGDPETSRMPFTGDPNGFGHFIPDWRDAGYYCICYTGSPHHARPLEFERWVQDGHTERIRTNGGWFAFDHSADEPPGSPVDAMIQWLERDEGVWVWREAVHPSAPSIAHCYQWGDKRESTHLDIMIVQKPQAGPWGEKPAERFAWIIRTAERLARETRARLAIPRWVIEKTIDEGRPDWAASLASEPATS